MPKRRLAEKNSRLAPFRTTEWGMIAAARADDSHARHAALEQLIERYWRPVYCYIRRIGYDADRAGDLVQGFFAKTVLERGLFGRAQRSRGRFRDFLLHALRNYVAEVHRHEKARIRWPGHRPLALDAAAGFDLPDATRHASPEASFHWAWASQLLEQVLKDVEEYCSNAGHIEHWRLFVEHIIQPIFDGTRSPSLAQLATRFGLPDAAAANNRIETVRRIFRTSLRTRIAPTCPNDESVLAEIADLKMILSTRCR